MDYCAVGEARSIVNLKNHHVNREDMTQREDYLMQLAAERVSGRPEDCYLSRHMVNGMEREDSSRALFEMIYGMEVRQVGIVFKDEERKFHCSPDGLVVGSNAPLEMKNAMQKTHVEYLMDNKVPTEYFGQCMMTMYVMESDILYFMSNSDGLPPLILEVRRDEEYIEKNSEGAQNCFSVESISIEEKIRSHKNMTPDEQLDAVGL